jgi:hypothetical protein
VAFARTDVPRRVAIGDDVADQLTRMWGGSDGRGRSPLPVRTARRDRHLGRRGDRLYIGYKGYRGLRRNDDRSMRWLSIGMILLFGVTYALAVAGQGLITFRLVPIHLQNVVRLVVRLVQVAGLACIAYSLQLAATR